MPKLTDERIARAYGYAAALQDRGGVDGQVGTAFLEVMQAYVEQRDALAQADALAVENARRLSALAAVCGAAECTGEDGWQRCVICDEVAQSGATIRHADGCPIGHARRALNER